MTHDPAKFRVRKFLVAEARHEYPFQRRRPSLQVSKASLIGRVPGVLPAYLCLDVVAGVDEWMEDVLFLDEDNSRIYRVLDATRGSPDSGWFVLALAGPNPRDSYERQHRIHNTDTHRVLLTHLEDDDRETEA